MTDQPLTPQAKLDLVRQAVIQANPQIEKRQFTRTCMGCGKQLGCIDDCDCEAPVAIGERPIRLADVLLAISEDRYSLRDEVTYEVMEKYAYEEWGSATIADIVVHNWRLDRDFLDDQNETCFTFLHSLLCA